MESQLISAIDEQMADESTKFVQANLLNMRSLTEAFNTFNEKTRKLQESYNGLKKEVEAVNEELKQKNETLKRKIDELDMTRDYLNNIVESMSSGLIAVNLRERITTFNRAAEKITGYSRNEVLGTKYSSIFPQEASCGSILGRMIMKPDHRVFDELALITKSGGRIPIGVSISPVRDNNNHLVGAIEIFNDLTEIKELEEQVRRADRLAALGEMAASVAHEIRNPLGGIEGFAALLERDLAEDANKREMVHNIVEGARMLNKIVSSLLDFTRPVRISCEEVNVEEVLESAISLVSGDRNGKLKEIDIKRQLHPDNLIRADKQLLLQVFINLIRNAIQAMNGSGILTLETERENGAFHIRIGDTGCGIPDEIKSRLFMPFVTTKQDGTGLGLPTVMKIISAHNGKIEYKTSTGEGTVFIITLPATKVEQA